MAGRWQWLSARAALVGVLALTLVASGAELVPVAAATKGAKPSPVKVTERPDSRSAMLTARSQGSEVEDLSQRTETSSTWAEPDGTWKSELHGAQQRFRDGRGDWKAVDLSLAGTADGGELMPAQIAWFDNTQAGNRSVLGFE